MQWQFPNPSPRSVLDLHEQDVPFARSRYTYLIFVFIWMYRHLKATHNPSSTLALYGIHSRRYKPPLPLYWYNESERHEIP
jgi:hypothetical protein